MSYTSVSERLSFFYFFFEVFMHLQRKITLETMNDSTCVAHYREINRL